MKPITWWLRHDRIGRSRLFLIVVAWVLMLTWIVFDWPSLRGAAVAVIGTLVLAVGDYFFWRADMRKAENTETEAPS